MTIDVALSPADITLLPQQDLSATTCVVFDVLRATSSMITGLAHGAAEIHPVRTVEEALARRAQLPDALLGGERHGDRIAGFDLGNSPLEYLHVRGRKIVTTTTNGTIALCACEGAQRVLVGAILNLGALVAEIHRSQPGRLLLVCAGTFADFALEDAYGAGLLIRMLGKAELTDAAHAALGVAQLYPEPLDALRRARNGHVLATKGRGEEVEWCAQVSRFSAVGLMEGMVIRPLGTA
jgi:2-phosphosulfolactate phosphatase